MSEVKKKLINEIVEELNNENKRRIEDNKTPLDVCYMVSVLDQQIENCKEFMQDISTNKFIVNGYEEDNTGGYTNGKLTVLIEKPDKEKESEYIIDAYYNYIYEIEFGFDNRYWGYCECSPNDEGYNPVHKCCGNGCDWSAPAFSVHKIETLGSYSWCGLEKDYWEYEKKFNEDINNKNIEVEKFKKEQSLAYINKQVEELLAKKKDLENELQSYAS